jgi:ribonucleoside-diphosphate reductase alpha chain
VVVGGVRRSSLISLFDFSNDQMINSKSGNNWPKRRMMANNSMVFEDKPSAANFLKAWATLASNGTGEPGIFNLEQAQMTAPDRRDADLITSCNPCGEAMLRDRGLCNLSSVILRAEDDLDDVFEKIETAVWIGIIQSTFTDFHFVGPEWKKNCEDERLLGVSLSGQMDAPHLMTPDNLSAMKKKALKVARKAAKLMDINMPAAITCVKPEGTSSQLTSASSGMHPRYSKYYIRRYRVSSHDPLCNMLKAQGVNLIPDVGQDPKNCSTYVVEFPIKSPEGCITKDDVTALQQLEHYKKIQENWCEMNASQTIYVKNEDWIEVGNWVYKNWEIVNGLSFLPADCGVYSLAPYQSISKDEYEKLVNKFKPIDYSQLPKFEMEDNTTGAKTLSCSGDKCELN